MFYRFVGADKLQNFQLDKVLFFDNRVLENKFQEYFNYLSDQTLKSNTHSSGEIKIGESAQIPIAISIPKETESPPKESEIPIMKQEVATSKSSPKGDKKMSKLLRCSLN